MTRPDHTTSPDYSYEETFLAQGYRRVAGVDEVGRGPIAGPVTAAAVILDVDNIPDGIMDSKVVPDIRRRRLAREIRARALAVSVVHLSAAEVDELNIRMASCKAMLLAILSLDPPPDTVLIDGIDIPAELQIPAQALVKGDSKSFSVAAASIVAKVSRDKEMTRLAFHYPEYGWGHNVGYATKKHKAALQKYGPTRHHRRSFKPVIEVLATNSNAL
ncbi:MAG: ribonuclease HII [Aestuariivita sp.]|nr:ribonuclease HII [Aestuariivita sp.]MCY4202366.1 ribonuclease HII [Aestuariivita sp.]